jgi:phosphatidylserine/phosphatidylglycerophosphate/cardiolipin synthase-like enzyme
VIKLLYTSADVRQAVVDLFRNSFRRRVAISAFVGDGAEAYLPKPKGLKLYCWPKEGGTNPEVLRRLKRRGVDIYFANSLHMKVYWTSGVGAVVTSANLSRNALGSGNLKEVGVLLDPRSIDINRLVRSLRAHHPTAAEMDRLDRLHRRYVVRNNFALSRTTALSYDQWYEEKLRPEWKLGWWDSTGSAALEAIKRTKEEYNRYPEDFISARRGDYKEGEWILTFKLLRTPSNLKWMFAHYLINVHKKEKIYDPTYPVQAVQALALKSYPLYPFRLGKRFSKAFVMAIEDYGVDRIKELKSSRLPSNLKKLIYKYFQHASTRASALR